MVFIFRIQREHKIILLSSKAWVKYGLNIGKVQQQVSSHLLFTETWEDHFKNRQKQLSYKLYKNYHCTFNCPWICSQIPWESLSLLLLLLLLFLLLCCYYYYFYQYYCYYHYYYYQGITWKKIWARQTKACNTL